MYFGVVPLVPLVLEVVVVLVAVMMQEAVDQVVELHLLHFALQHVVQQVPPA